jgi:peptidoglycan/xylan/chitin deacetylase (PgdA/CDA1 family)
MMKKLMLAVAVVCTAYGCAPDDGDDSQGNGEPYSAEGIEAWGEAYQTRESGKSDQPGCNGVIVPDQSGFGGRVSLTFDDGPSASSTPKVLDILAEHDIKATFFINGVNVNSETEPLLQRILEEGHILGNHSQHHEDLKRLEFSKVEPEVEQTHQIILDAGGDPLYFRFPFGSSNCQTMDLVKSYGYRSTGWHTDSADWCFASSLGGVGYCDERTFKWVTDSMRDDMLGFVMNQVDRKNGGIVLFHDKHMNTANHLDEIITALEDADYTFVNIDDTSTYPLLNTDDLSTFPWVGSTCQEDADCEFAETGTCLGYESDGMPQGFCVNQGCEGYCQDFPGRAPTFCVDVDGTQTGSCVPKAHDFNNNCADLPGTVPTAMGRFVGSSNAPASTAEVCLPAP